MNNKNFTNLNSQNKCKKWLFMPKETHKDKWSSLSPLITACKIIKKHKFNNHKSSKSLKIDYNVLAGYKNLFNKSPTFSKTKNKPSPLTQ